MARFLSPEWLAELDAAVRALADPPDLSLSLEQVVAGGPDGDVRYTIEAGQGGLAVRPGPGSPADVTLHTDWETAVALSRGELGAQEAFVRGRLRPAGDLAALLRAGPALGALADALASLRAETTYA